MNFSPYLLELLGVKQLPGMKEKWMELLLQGVLYDDRESYYADSAYLEQLETKLKHEGLVDKRKVTLVTNSKVEKLLISSKGKVESIKQIVRTEYEALHSELRMLILTDYIKKEYVSYIGKEEKECSALGVIPFFEVLRREHSKGLKLGVLCGSVVILPTEAKERLEQLLEESRVSCSTIETLPNKDYMIVTPQGGHNELTQVVTQLFTEGSVQVLIGTKALLGEGWDAPCINSLILASFVGSYMVSNQMRGWYFSISGD